MLRAYAFVLLLLSMADVCPAQTPADTSATTDYILLTNNQRLTGSVTVDDDAIRGLGVVHNHATRYDLNELTSFTANGVFFTRHSTLRRRGDFNVPEPLLLARVAEGNLDLYTIYRGYTSALDNPSFDYFEKHDGAMQRLSYSSLKPALSDNPESLRLLKKSRTWGAVRFLLLTAGAATFGYGIYQSVLDSNKERVLSPPGSFPVLKETEFHFTVNPIAPLGLGIVFSSIFPHNRQKARVRAAIRAYQ